MRFQSLVSTLKLGKRKLGALQKQPHSFNPVRGRLYTPTGACLAPEVRRTAHAGFDTDPRVRRVGEQAC